MQKILMILEVSQKQNYVFASKALKENIQHSANISRVTSSDYFAQVCPRDYDERVNLVYSGGGHTVLQFFAPEEADRFARQVTRRAMEDYPGLELFVKQLAYDETQTPGDNLNELSRRLEKKKSFREHAFRTLALGIEKAEGAIPTGSSTLPFKVPNGWKVWDLQETAGGRQISAEKDNFQAIVHIDGNAMGARVQDIYKSCRDSWPQCCRLLDLFSKEIDRQFTEAFDEMAQELADALDRTEPVRKLREEGRTPELPLRKIICAGDDVCFQVPSGRHGLECAASFLRHLSTKRNRADGKYYTACAGVVLVHQKYPFRPAYEMSEALCRSAKHFCAEAGPGVRERLSALDFHIEYGQLKGSLEDIRSDYLTDDGARLELRPLAVTGTEGVPRQRTYRFHTAQLRRLLELLDEQEKKRDVEKGRGSGLARSKVKSLRPYLHQGEVETAYALKKTNSKKILDLNPGEGAFFTDPNGIRRSLYFDTIELLDATELWQEVTR